MTIGVLLKASAFAGLAPIEDESMLRDTNDLEDFTLGATDGEIGDIKDFYFDDDAWVVRYLVVDTGTWLSSRMVLISPIAIGKPDRENKVLPLSITRAQVKDSPDIDTAQPVNRQRERQVLDHYGFLHYWGGAGLWGGGFFPYALLPGEGGLAQTPASRPDLARPADAAEPSEAAPERPDDPHLRSCEEVKGYHIHASDGDIGHVQGFLVDEETWQVRYLIVNTSNWWFGHEVLISPSRILAVNWSDNTVTVDMTRQAVKDARPYDADALAAQDQETGVYQRPGPVEPGTRP